jgi:hypothetical protein
MYNNFDLLFNWFNHLFLSLCWFIVDWWHWDHRFDWWQYYLFDWLLGLCHVN